MPEIELKNLSISFGDKGVLKKLNYKFTNGIIVLRGESGAGKTTLLHIISGIYKQYTGKVVFSKDSKLSYCLQEDLFFGNLSVSENMFLKHNALGLSSTDKEEAILYALKLFNIEHLMDIKTKNLSGGERQRLKMAMLVFGDPNIILLDEPTAKLDEDNAKQTLEVIEKVYSDKLVIIVTHEKLVFSKPCINIRLKGGALYEEK